MIECSFDKRPIFLQKDWKWQNGWSNFRRKFRKLFLWTTKMPLRERSQNFWPMSELYSLEVWKTKKNFLKTLFSSKCSSGHSEWKFGHTANFSAKSPRKFNFKSRKVGEKLFFEGIVFFLQGDPLGPKECGFEESSEFFSKKSKIDKFGHRTSGNISTKGSSGCVMCSLENAVKIFLPKSEGFSIKVWKGQKNFHSLKLCFPRKSVFVFIDCKIGKHVKTNMPTVQKVLLQVRKKWKMETLLEKDFFTRWSSGMIECSFDKRAFFPEKSESDKMVHCTSEESSENCSFGQPKCR